MKLSTTTKLIINSIIEILSFIIGGLLIPCIICSFISITTSFTFEELILNGKFYCALVLIYIVMIAYIIVKSK